YLGQGAIATNPPLVFPDNNVPLPGGDELPAVPSEGGGQAQTQVPPGDGGGSGSGGGSGQGGSVGSGQGTGGDGSSPNPPTQNYDVRLLSGVFAKCASCHKSTTSGTSLEDFKLTFGSNA